MMSWSAQMKLPYSGLENLPKGTNCPNVIGGCGNKQVENKTRQLYKSNFPTNVWEAITGYWRASWPQAEVPSLFISDRGKRKREKAQTSMENLKPIPGVPRLPTGPGLKWGIQLQRHLLLGRCLCWAPCPKSYFNHWKSCSCGQGSPVELPKHRHVALLVMPQAHCLVASSCSRWTCASCRSHRTFQDWTVRTSQHQKVSQMSQKS